MYSCNNIITHSYILCCNNFITFVTILLQPNSLAKWLNEVIETEKENNCYNKAKEATDKKFNLNFMGDEYFSRETLLDLSQQIL